MCDFTNHVWNLKVNFAEFKRKIVSASSKNRPSNIYPNIYNSSQQVLAVQWLVPYKVTNITLGFETLKHEIRSFEPHWVNSVSFRFPLKTMVGYLIPWIWTDPTVVLNTNRNIKCTSIHVSTFF